MATVTAVPFALAVFVRREVSMKVDPYYFGGNP